MRQSTLSKNLAFASPDKAITNKNKHKDKGKNFLHYL